MPETYVGEIRKTIDRYKAAMALASDNAARYGFIAGFACELDKLGAGLDGGFDVLTETAINIYALDADAVQDAMWEGVQRARNDAHHLEPGKPPVTPEKQDLAQHRLKAASSARSITADETTAGMRKEVYALSEGDVTLTFPEGLSAESVKDLEGYIEIFLRKVRRDTAKPVGDSEQ